MKLFNKPKPKGWQGHPFSLDRPLIQFSPYDAWKIRDACEGAQIFGAIGSGKTSGSGQTLAKAFLSAGFGGLVLAMKVDERTLWEQYCRETGRELIIFSPSQPWRFNFLDYEVRRKGSGAGMTTNIVNLFTNAMEIGQKSGRDDPYWRRSMEQMLSRAIDLLIFAKGSLKLIDLYNVIKTAPRSPGETLTDDWGERFCAKMLKAAQQQTKTARQRQDFAVTSDYFLGEFPELAEKTRSIIISSFTGLANGFLTGMINELFCTETNIVPEVTHHGAVILLDFPIREFGELGVLAQVLFKYLWQNATERRSIADNPRPVFLWIDEAQEFITSYDRKFQSTARSCRACSVFLSQNINGYYAALGGDRATINALMGNFQTKIFHANGDVETNEWASKYFAQTWESNPNVNTQYDHTVSQAENRYSAGAVRALENQVLPIEFARLAKGAPENNFQVQAILGQGGRTYRANGRTFLNLAFNQKNQWRI